MNILPCTIAGLLLVAAALAEEAQFKIEVRYRGFDPKYFTDPATDETKAVADAFQAKQEVTVRAGQTAQVEIAKEVVLPISKDGKAPEGPRGPVTTTATDVHGNTTVDGRKTVNCGVTLEVSPELKEGQIVLSGKSTLRRLLDPEAKAPLNALSFTSHETYFSDAVKDGAMITIPVGDGADDKAHITLTVRRVAAK